MLATSAATRAYDLPAPVAPAQPRARARTGERLACADAFRALASISIVTGHLFMFSALSVRGHLALVGLLTAFGICGVNCFFVLSGLLLGRPFVDALIDPARTLPSLRDFAVRRFWRIYPLYALAVVLSALGPVVHRHGPIPWGYLATHLTFLHGFSVRYVNAVQDGPLWTMAVDVQFYLALPLAALGLGRLLRGHGRATRIRAIVAALVALAAASLALRYPVFAHVPLTLHSFAASAVYARNALGMGSAFAFGIGLALLMATTRAPSRPVALAALGLAAGLGLLLAPTGLDTSASVMVQTTYDFVAAAAVALAIYALAGRRAFAASAPPRSIAPAARRPGAGTAVGAVALISYPFYLFHWPVLMVVLDTVSRFHLHGGSTAYALVVASLALGGTVLVAVAAQLAVDRALRGLRGRPARAA